MGPLARRGSPATAVDDRLAGSRGGSFGPLEGGPSGRAEARDTWLTIVGLAVLGALVLALVVALALTGGTAAPADVPRPPATIMVA